MFVFLRGWLCQIVPSPSLLRSTLLGCLLLSPIQLQGQNPTATHSATLRTTHIKPECHIRSIVSVLLSSLLSASGLLESSGMCFLQSLFITNISVGQLDIFHIVFKKRKIKVVCQHSSSCQIFCCPPVVNW